MGNGDLKNDSTNSVTLKPKKSFWFDLIFYLSLLLIGWATSKTIFSCSEFGCGLVFLGLLVIMSLLIVGIVFGIKFFIKKEIARGIFIILVPIIVLLTTIMIIGPYFSYYSDRKYLKNRASLQYYDKINNPNFEYKGIVLPIPTDARVAKFSDGYRNEDVIILGDDTQISIYGQPIVNDKRYIMDEENKFGGKKTNKNGVNYIKLPDGSNMCGSVALPIYRIIIEDDQKDRIFLYAKNNTDTINEKEDTFFSRPYYSCFFNDYSLFDLWGKYQKQKQTEASSEIEKMIDGAYLKKN